MARVTEIQKVEGQRSKVEVMRYNPLYIDLRHELACNSKVVEVKFGFKMFLTGTFPCHQVAEASVVSRCGV